MAARTILLEAEENCRRLDVFLSENGSLSRSRAEKLVETGAVKIDGILANKVSRKISAGEKIEFTFPEDVPLDLPAENIPIEIVYEDDFLAVVNKGQGLTVHPANGVNSGTLVNALLYRLSSLSGINGVLRPGIVHRIDKDTSGLLVVAKNDVAHVELQKQIQSKLCRRIYIALLEGAVKQDSGIIDAPIGRSRADRKKMDIVEDGRNAVTEYSVLQRYASNTLIRFELKTGRTHQIRVHAKYIGHPVVGDKTYGFKHQRFNLDGQLLHAETIIFNHPDSGKEMRFVAELPEYFKKVLKTIENEKIAEGER